MGAVRALPTPSLLFIAHSCLGFSESEGWLQAQGWGVGAQVQGVAELSRDHVDGAGVGASTELLLPPAAAPRAAMSCSLPAHLPLLEAGMASALRWHSES